MDFPKHIAFIMDGNGRWAKKRFLTRSAGHKAGAEALRKLVNECEKIGVEYVTVYAFSTENWKRPDDEVKLLMDLMRSYMQRYIGDADKNNIKMVALGDISKLDKDLQDKIIFLQEKTKNKTGIQLNIALNYGSRDEIVRAAKRMAVDVKKGFPIDRVNEKVFAAYLDTKGMPDPELLIRTSGELRISNFLLWQLAYTELYFTDKLWPDFNINDLQDAIHQYQSRDRRFGGRE